MSVFATTSDVSRFENAATLDFLLISSQLKNLFLDSSKELPTLANRAMHSRPKTQRSLARALGTALLKEPAPGVERAYAALLDRLDAECQERGRAQAIARATGITPQHLCRVRKRKANIGELFARSLAEYWGLDFRAVNALRAPNRAPEALPNLRAALEFCRDVYPMKFLKHIEQLARRQERDRRKPAWVAWLESNFWDWKEEQRRNA